MNKQDLTKYAYQPWAGTKRKSYKAYRYEYHDGKLTVIGPPVAIVMRDEPRHWIATLAGTGIEVCLGHGPTRDAAIDDALSAIGDS